MYLMEFKSERDVLIRSQVRADLLSLLFRQSFLSAIGSMLGALMLCWLCRDRVDSTILLTWLAALGVSTLIRLGMLIAYFRTPEVSRTPKYWEPRYWLTLILSAAIWGSGALAIMIPGDLVTRALVLLFAVGMSVSAVSCYSSYRSMTLVSMTLVLLPSTLWLLLQPHETQVGMAIASLVFAYFVISATRKLSDAMEKAYRLTREMEYAHRIAHHAAQTDELTGLKNRRAFFHDTAHSFEYCKLSRLPLCAVMLDLDHFKRVNDTYGHQAGDRVLQMIGAVISQSVRDVDVCGRLGGEEFALLLTNASYETARATAEQLRLAIANIDCHGIGGLTASLGIAALNEDDQDVHALLARADKALFKAKALGRNQMALA